MIWDIENKNHPSIEMLINTDKWNFLWLFNIHDFLLCSYKNVFFGTDLIWKPDEFKLLTLYVYLAIYAIFCQNNESSQWNDIWNSLVKTQEVFERFDLVVVGDY